MTLRHTPQAQIGSPASDFKLPGTDGKLYRMTDFSGQALVIVFTCNHCPYAQAVWPRLIRLAAAYQPRGIDFVAINPNDATAYPEDSFEEMKKKVGEWGINFPYLRDEIQAVARAYGAVCTPDIFVYDAQKLLVYRGRFDDNWKNEDKVTCHDLQNVLDQILSGHTKIIEQHPSMGCSIKWKI